jgi:hypothetical protein
LAVPQTAIGAMADRGGLLRNLRETPMSKQAISRILRIGHFSRSTATCRFALPSPLQPTSVADEGGESGKFLAVAGGRTKIAYGFSIALAV